MEKEKINSTIERMLVERLNNFSNEALIIVKQQGEPKLKPHKKLEIILESLKKVSSSVIHNLIVDSDLKDNDKILLNLLYGSPRNYVLGKSRSHQDKVNGVKKNKISARCEWGDIRNQEKTYRLDSIKLWFWLKFFNFLI